MFETLPGKANVLGWNASHNPPVGKWGACCAEMDIWEANSKATAYTPHPCSLTGPYTCEGIECGDNSKESCSCFYEFVESELGRGWLELEKDCRIVLFFLCKQ